MEYKHISVKVEDEGYDIYVPRKSQTWGYRYGPSIMTYGDGRIDAWFASPGAAGEADWFTYRHSDDYGKNWSDEIVVLTPTADSMDFFSVCDPGVVYFGGYYYIGYTSTIFTDRGGICNNCFVARSRYPYGPFEKWTDKGWGEHRGDCHWMGKPAPIIYFDEDHNDWGAGEFSFVAKDDVLYMYYTWTSTKSDGSFYSQTRVATADADDENWPLTIKQRGVAIERTSGANDSTDVIYVRDLHKFVGIATDRRFTEKSVIVIYESDDGSVFTRVNELNTNIGIKCHNSGISGGPDHCVNSGDLILIGYAYGSKWGYWGTRFHSIKLELTDEPDFSDSVKNNIDRPVIPIDDPAVYRPIAISSIPHFYEKHICDGAFDIDLHAFDSTYRNVPVDSDVTFSNYDPSVIHFEGLKCIPRAVGYSFANATWQGRTTEFLVYIRDDSTRINADDPVLISFKPMQQVYYISLEKREHKHISGMAVYDDNTWHEIFGTDKGIVYSGYDASLVCIDNRGIISAKKDKGSTKITATCCGLFFTVEVIVI